MATVINYGTIKLFRFGRGDNVDNFYYHLLNLANVGKTKEVTLTVKINSWWWDKLAHGCKEQILNMITSDFKNIKKAP